MQRMSDEHIGTGPSPVSGPLLGPALHLMTPTAQELWGQAQLEEARAKREEARGRAWKYWWTGLALVLLAAGLAGAWLLQGPPIEAGETADVARALVHLLVGTLWYAFV